MSRPWALYRYYNVDNTLLYVGISNLLANRFYSHEAHKTWITFTTTIKVEWFINKNEAVHAENVAIKQEKPIYNFAQPTYKKSYVKRTGNGDAHKISKTEELKARKQILKQQRDQVANLVARAELNPQNKSLIRLLANHHTIWKIEQQWVAELETELQPEREKANL